MDKVSEKYAMSEQLKHLIEFIKKITKKMKVLIISKLFVKRIYTCCFESNENTLWLQ